MVILKSDGKSITFFCPTPDRTDGFIYCTAQTKRMKKNAKTLYNMTKSYPVMEVNGLDLRILGLAILVLDFIKNLLNVKGNKLVLATSLVMFEYSLRGV